MERQPSFWEPMTDQLILAVLGKLGEEANETAQRVCRCIIQGLNEFDPDTKASNRHELEKEIGDLEANIELAKQYLSLRRDYIEKRKGEKLIYTGKWLSNLKEKGNQNGI